MSKRKISRREFIKRGTAAGTCAAFSGVFPLQNKTSFPYLKNKKISNKVVALGFDGMDPVLLQRFIAEGQMPTFEKLQRMGHLGLLQTTLPPQSPVAWASFITGTNPGGHGIFDFIHRDPKSFTPYLSTSRSFGTERSIKLGSYAFPLEAEEVRLMRKGKPFWNTLEEHDIPASLYKLPANFPVASGKTRAISGMSTPDLLGTYGTFTYITDAFVPNAEEFSGGRVLEIELVNHHAKAKLAGPPNSFSREKEAAELELRIDRDPLNQVAKISVGDKSIILKKGEWSEWVPLRFEFLSIFSGVSGMLRFYLQDVHPEFRLYASPINIDPSDPVLPICNPANYSSELSQVLGRFYTQGFPEDTKALSHGVFSNEEFLTQAKIVLDERLHAFDYELSQFKEGFLFFYFSSIDQNTHMMWRLMDPSHPLYEPRASKEVKEAVKFFYTSMDEVLRKTLDSLDSHSTLFALSDHGFAPFSREFNVSTWLAENGYTSGLDEHELYNSKFYSGVDWGRTKAYALGLNGIYLNLKDREPEGVLSREEAVAVKTEIIRKISQARDPLTGEKVLIGAYDAEEVYSGPYLSLAPDIVLGYASNYRISDTSVLGEFPYQVFTPREDKWSADHCMDPSVVPGVLLSNREIKGRAPAIWDLAPSILSCFGLKAGKEIDGKSFV